MCIDAILRRAPERERHSYKTDVDFEPLDMETVNKICWCLTIKRPCVL